MIELHGDWPFEDELLLLVAERYGPSNLPKETALKCMDPRVRMMLELVSIDPYDFITLMDEAPSIAISRSKSIEYRDVFRSSVERLYYMFRTGGDWPMRIYGFKPNPFDWLLAYESLRAIREISRMEVLTERTLKEISYDKKVLLWI